MARMMNSNGVAHTREWPRDLRNIFGSGLPWLAAAAFGIAAVYWTGLVSLLDAWTRPEYSHGYFIPAVAGFLFLRAMRDMEPRRVAADGDGFGSIVGIAFVIIGLAV